MKKKPDILVVLAVVLGFGITLSSIGNTGEPNKQALQPSATVPALEVVQEPSDKQEKEKQKKELLANQAVATASR